MINALFVVWRESFEAVLIVGILYAYLKKQANIKEGMKAMWMGVVGGLLLSSLLAVGINFAETEFQGKALEFFQIGMLIVACFMMTHMCLWMSIHGRKMKGELESELKTALSTTKLAEVSILSCLAVAREGSEVVIYLYGMAIEASQQGHMTPFIGYSFVGFVLAFLTWYVFNHGLSFFGQKVFFRVTSLFLLLTASNLITTVTRRLIQSDILPKIKDVAWDTSAFLDERSKVGGFISGLCGYESTPALSTVIVFFLYWTLTFVMYKYLTKKDAMMMKAKVAAA
jgi:high-affinity iron transporter